MNNLKPGRRTILRGVSAAMLGTTAFPAAPKAQGQQRERVVLAVANTGPGAESACFYAGKALGFYEEAGIDLAIEFGQGVAGATSLVASGVADMALSGLEALPGFVAKGIPMKAFYVYADRSIFNLAFLAGAKIQSAKELKRARIGVITLASGSIPTLQFILRQQGLAVSDVELIPVGAGPTAIAAIKAGRIDALMYHDTGFAALEAEGIQFKYYEDPRLNDGYPGLGFVAMETRLTSRRRAFESFCQASTRSIAYSIQNPGAAIEAFAKLYPEIGKKNLKVEESVWIYRTKIMKPMTEKGGVLWGNINNNETAWNNLQEILILAGDLKAKLPVASLYTDNFIRS